jgi:hypothetical protein
MKTNCQHFFNFVVYLSFVVEVCCFSCFNNCNHNLMGGIWVVWTYCCFHGDQTMGDVVGGIRES